MKACEKHWDMLKAEIQRIGLEQFVSKDAETAFNKTAMSLEDSQSGASDRQNRTFDPLLGAYWAIVANATRYVGLELYVCNEDGTDRCPLCFVTADHLARCKVVDCKFKDFDSWIGHAVEDQMEHAKSLGLVGST